MSTRSRLRPSTTKRQLSSRLIVESARPKKSAARRRTSSRYAYGPGTAGREALVGQCVPGGVEALPHLGGDGLAGAAGVEAGGAERALDGAGGAGVEGELVQDLLHVDAFGARVDTEDGVQGAAGHVLVAPGVLQEAVEVGVEDAAGGVRPLDVTARPGQGLGYAGEDHVVHCCCAPSCTTPRAPSGPSWRGTTSNAVPRPSGSSAIGVPSVRASRELGGVRRGPPPAPRCPWSRRPGWS